MSNFYMLVGVPGSGKSTWAAKTNVNTHSSDAIRQELFGDAGDQSHNDKVFKELQRRVKADLATGIDCIYDATNISRKRRMAFLQQINEHTKICILFCPPVEVCKARNLLRERKVPEDVIDRMVRNFEIPYVYEGWNKVIFVPNEQTASLPDMHSINQENKHHSLTLGDHMDKAADYCADHNFGITLELAAQFHDIGKLSIKSVDEKGAHYYDHHNYGAYLFLSTFSNIVLSDLYAAVLINWHMRPFLAWDKSEKAREKDRLMLGDALYGDIMKLHEADLFAH